MTHAAQACAALIADGVITHDAYKAMVLQLAPDEGDESDAERAIRAQLERKLERDLVGAFDDQLSALLPADASDDVIRSAPAHVTATSEPVREVLRRNLEQSSSLGVSVALDTLEQIGLGFEWTLAHSKAAEWASRYSYELVRGINSTTQARLQTAVDDWFKERTSLPDLVKELEPTFGRKRAKTISVTETTRAAAQGAVEGYEQSGVVSEWEWVTANDEIAGKCPICGPLNGKRAPLRGTFPGGHTIPAHVNCRCFGRPVIAEPS
jgi:SPP1 gp7 family putative phage head morphogenesis protein